MLGQINLMESKIAIRPSGIHGYPYVINVSVVRRTFCLCATQHYVFNEWLKILKVHLPPSSNTEVWIFYFKCKYPSTIKSYSILPFSLIFNFVPNFIISKNKISFVYRSVVATRTKRKLLSTYSFQYVLALALR